MERIERIQIIVSTNETIEQSSVASIKEIQDKTRIRRMEREMNYLMEN
jgi:hypothetical protein